MNSKAILICVLAASACTGRTLHVNSNPSGATFYEPATGMVAVTPATLTYNIAESARGRDGCFDVQPYEIRWASGARVAGDPKICGPGHVWSVSYTRPAGYPNLAIDLQAAGQQQAQAALAAQQQQQAAAQTLAVMAGYAVDSWALQQQAQADAAAEWERSRPIQMDCEIPNNQLGYTTRMTCEQN